MDPQVTRFESRRTSSGKSSFWGRIVPILSVYLLAGLLAGCGVQAIPQSKNQVEAALAEITNQYKRRADLIPNLVEVVKGYAKHEAQTLEAVVAARARATQMQVDASQLNAKQVQEFAQAQGELSTALGRLMMITENYPNLKADQNFRDLQAQLEGTENRITVARQRYIEAIQQFNNYVTVFPYSLTNSLFFKHEKMPQWTTEDVEQIAKPPEVKM